jgi:pyridoxal phosphate enzyme (YggS family)
MNLPTGEEIAARAMGLRARLDAAATRAGRDPRDVRIVAVTKTWPVEVARAAFDAGLTALGENRVQEALPKVEALPAAEWHLVGHLQANKARPAVTAFVWIHSVDSVALLRRLDAIAHDTGARPRLLLQVNVTDEPQKAGFAPADLESSDLVDAMRAARAARVEGLMAIARAGVDPRPAFAALRHLRDELRARSGLPLDELSMGMSGDVEEAVEEGATLVRVGTALFGPRT